MDGAEFFRRYPEGPEGCSIDNYKSFLLQDKVVYNDKDLNQLMVVIKELIFLAMNGIEGNRSSIDDNTRNIQSILHDVYGGAPPVAQSKKSKRRSKKKRKSQKSKRRR
jgi:hypothetical protein